LRIADRYDVTEILGLGGMGVVYRVQDRVLDRFVALKTARLQAGAELLRRLEQEAGASARLQHPNIVPVHDVGRLADERPWFTMKEVHGTTLGEEIRRGASQTEGRPFRRLLTAMLAVCRAVAYAHGCGVLHRDLKPDNVMLGAAGEVYVLDWGIASTHAHEVDVRLGTRGFMAPEQRRGESTSVRTDVFALGAILDRLLSSSVVDHDPAILAEARDRAMSPNPANRFDGPEGLAQELEAWLDGARRRGQALALARFALDREPEIHEAMEQAEALRAESAERSSSIAPWQSTDDKAASWALEDAADSAEERASRLDVELEQGLQAALRLAPDLPEAHAALAVRYQQQHAEAEARRESRAASRARLRLEFHLGALPLGHVRRSSGERYLRGDGALTLHSEPSGVDVRLYRYEAHGRRLVPQFLRSLGPTPLDEVPLPMGSYLCVLERPGFESVRVPVFVPRLGHAGDPHPGSGEVVPVRLPVSGELPADAVVVPPGWFSSGGDEGAYGAHPRRELWCDGFVMHRLPITNAQYIEFLDELVAAGREADALRWAPRERAASPDRRGALLYRRDEDGRFAVQTDADGDEWQLHWPVLFVDWDCARAYLAHLAQKTEHPWRLPGELEWEKAARGADGRGYPWGDFMDPTFCCMNKSHPGRRQPSEIHTFAVDESPAGVRGLGGNVRDWCLDADGVVDGQQVVIPEIGDVERPRAVRGGSWCTDARIARCATRTTFTRASRDPNLSLRGLFRWP
ncbi:MAG: SUMF1/EgtB/PvdO family nonheme iron enzyme, partial [Myxococcota bacterium]